MIPYKRHVYQIIQGVHSWLDGYEIDLQGQKASGKKSLKIMIV